MQKQTVWILNPPTNQRKFTSLNRARRFVRKGKAAWIETGKSIRFLEGWCQALRPDPTRRGYDLAAYEGQAQIQQISNLPMVAVSRFLNCGKRKGATGHAFRVSRGR